MVEVISLPPAELQELFREWGEPRYRADQLFRWIHRRNCLDYAEMTDLPLPLRRRLAEQFPISAPKIEAELRAGDGTRKISLRLTDGEIVESVLLPEPDYFSLCISSQAGCPIGCRFCATGRTGFRRNLTPGEILAQVALLRRSVDSDAGKLGNILFMGMGDPLLNPGAVRRVISLLTHRNGLGLSPRRIIVSSAGIIPEVTAVAEASRVRIAISLAGPTPELRATLVPRLEQQYPLTQLLDALRQLPHQYPGRLMIEYVLVGGVNDSDWCANELVRRLRGIRARINLIPLNPFPESDLVAPAPERVVAFQKILREKGKTAFIREPRGDDIQAACGQLAGKVTFRSRRSGSGRTG